MYAAVEELLEKLLKGTTTNNVNTKICFACGFSTLHSSRFHFCHLLKAEILNTVDIFVVIGM